MNNIDKINHNQCYGCQACSNVCPSNCINMVEDDKGFLLPKVDKMKCTNCGLCLRTCPAQKQKIDKAYIKLYAANTKSEIVREKSTSGGIFYHLAEYVLNREGHVYGVAYDDNYEVVHICIKDINEIERCMKSKYVQSNLGTTYRQIAEQSQNRMILFTGTPCQVAALSKYPGVNRENLILIENICHGVPSPKLWKKYIMEKEGVHGRIEKIVTRDKTQHGSTRSETVIQFANGYEYRKVLDEDEYMCAFMKGYSLRERCYDCQYKGRNRKGDLIVGDFGGAARYIKDADSRLGVSMLIVNSDRGMWVLEQIKDKLELSRIYSKKPLLSNWTWGLSIPYKRQNDYFYQICFGQECTINRSVKKTALYIKRKDKGQEKADIKEACMAKKHKIIQWYYEYIFRI